MTSEGEMARDDVGNGEGESGGGGEEEEDDDYSGDGGEISGGEGAAAFAGVLAVGVEVEEVVDDVGCGGAEAEADEGNDGGGDEAAVVGVGEEEGKKDEDVLGPLMDSDGLWPSFERGDLLAEDSDGGDFG